MNIFQIGETAGAVWHALESGGPSKLAALKKRLGVPDSLLYLALGWLAREDKIAIEPDGRSYRVLLK